MWRTGHNELNPIEYIQPAIAEQFVNDLADAINFVKDPPYEVPKTGFLYGRDVLRQGMKGYVEASYEYEQECKNKRNLNHYPCQTACSAR